MGGIHKKVKKYSLSQNLIKGAVGDKTYDQAHFLGTSMEKQYDATKAAERQAAAIANEPAIPLPDEEELARQRRRTRRSGGRASTVLTDDEKLGG
jgi:hypothetical protein